jgi:Phage portal protein
VSDQQVFVLDSQSGAIVKVNGALLAGGMEAAGAYFEIGKAVSEPKSVGSKRLRDKYGVTLDGVVCAARPFDMYLYAYAVTLNTYHCRAVRAKAKDIAGAPWKITGKGASAKRQEVVDFFEGFFGGRGFNEGCENVWTDYEALGNAYVEIVPDKTGIPCEGDHIPSTEMWVRLDGLGFVQVKNGLYSHFRRYGLDPKKYADLLPSDPLSDARVEANGITSMWHFNQYFPWSLYYGIPSIMPAWNRMALTVLETEYNLAFFGNNAIPDYAVILEGPWGDDAEGAIRDYFKRHLKGKSHKTLATRVPEGCKITFQELTSKEAKEGAFRLLRVDCRDEILQAHGVPPQKVGIVQTGRLGGNSSGEQNQEYKSSIVVPGRKKLTTMLNQLLAARFPGTKFLFEFEPYDTDDLAANATTDQIYLQTQVLTPGQVQAKRFPELPERPGSDQVLPYKAGATQAADPNAGEGLGGLQKLVLKAIEEARA